MGRINPDILKKTRELRAMGLTLAEISKQVGVPVCTVHRYCVDPDREYKELADYQDKMTFAQQYEWTRAVNRIRKYCHKKPFPLPELPEKNWEKHYEQITTQTS